MMCDRIDKKGLIQTDSKFDPLKRLNKVREKKVMQDLEKVSSDGNSNIGIFYGVGHLPNIEEDLKQRGYIKENIKFLEAIKWLHR